MRHRPSPRLSGLAGPFGLFGLFAPSTPSPDFLRPVRGPHRLVRLLCAAALLALLPAVLEARQAWLERTSAQAERDRAAGRVERLRAAAAAQPAAPAIAKDEAQPLLAHPWMAVLHSVETASVARVRWLALEHGIDGALRLEGQTADAAAALRVADTLQAQPTWQDTALSRIERSDPAATRQRFEIRARWAGGTAWQR